jgi:hypothetical protein
MQYKLLFLFLFLTYLTNAQSGCKPVIAILGDNHVLKKNRDGLKLEINLIKDSTCGDSLILINFSQFVSGSQMIADTSAKNWQKMLGLELEFILFNAKNDIITILPNFASYKDPEQEYEAHLPEVLDTITYKLKKRYPNPSDPRVRKTLITKKQTKFIIYPLLKSKIQLKQGYYTMVLVYSFNKERMIFYPGWDKIKNESGNEHIFEGLIISNPVKILVK